MTPPRFLLDEHVPFAIRQQLQRLSEGMDVLVMGHPPAPAKGTPDPDILLWVEKTGYILVTNNRHTMPEYVKKHFEAGRHLPGILWLRPEATLGQITEQLYLMWAASEAKEYVDRTLYIPL